LLQKLTLLVLIPLGFAAFIVVSVCSILSFAHVGIEWQIRVVGVTALELALAIVVTYMLLRCVYGDLKSRVQTLIDDARAISARSDALAVYPHDEFDQLDRLIGQISLRAKTDKVRRHQFFSMLAHDMRAPLSQIWFLLGMLADGRYDDEPEVRRGKIRKVFPEVGRLTRLVEDLLTLDRLESEKLVLTKEPASLNGLLEEVRDALEMETLDRSIRLTLETSSDDVLVDCDVFQIKRVLINLCSNALKYSASDSVVRMSVGVVSDDKATIEVWDQGPGIGDELKERIFDRYQQGDDPLTKFGFGLGLSIARTIVEEHGGHIAIRDRPDDVPGAVFFFTVPLCKDIVIGEQPNDPNDEPIPRTDVAERER
jgi:signal transduction histidine kinase